MRTPVAFVGYSGSGKTTLLVSLVRSLAAGATVAVIKHTHHSPATRKLEGDTELFLEAGAKQVVLAGAGGAVLLDPSGRAEPFQFESVTELPERLACEYILVEGFKSLDLWPRILVERAGSERVRPVPSVTAVVTDSSEDFDVPRFRHDDLAGLIAFVDRITTTR